MVWVWLLHFVACGGASDKAAAEKRGWLNCSCRFICKSCQRWCLLPLLTLLVTDSTVKFNVGLSAACYQVCSRFSGPFCFPGYWTFFASLRRDSWMPHHSPFRFFIITCHRCLHSVLLWFVEAISIWTKLRNPQTKLVISARGKQQTNYHAQQRFVSHLCFLVTYIHEFAHHAVHIVYGFWVAR